MANEFERKQRELSQQAAKIDATYRASRKAVLADVNLSQQGKDARLKAIDLERQGKVAALKADAELQLAAARAANKVALKKAKAAEVDKQRGLLGDQVYMQLLDRRVRNTSAVNAVALLEQSAHEWERAMLEIMVGEKLQDLLDAGEESQDLYLAGARFEAIRTKNAELEELQRQAAHLEQDADIWLQTMDGDAYRADFGARFRVNPEYVQVPGYEATGA